MRTHECRWLVVVLLLFPSIFLLQACGGGSGSGQTVRTVPSIGSISPTSVAAGAAGFTLTVTGTSFLSGATVCWNGAALPTTLVSATELRATVAGSQLATGATVTITAVNPGSGGGTSSGVTFAVSNPAPVVARMAPSWAQAGSTAALISIDGSGFTSGSQIRWNGTAVTTTYVDANRLTASVPALNLASAGTASVTVFNPSPGGGTSPTLVFTTFAAGPSYVTSLSLDVAAMTWDASRGRIYAALSGSAANGNSLVAINPLTGATTTPVFVGSDPKLLALSSDASHLWVSLDGASAIQRVTLPSMTPDVRINIPSYWYGPQVALAMQAAPVSPNALAVVIGDHRVAPPDTGGVAIYDGTVQRPGTIPGQYPADMTWLVWGSDDSKLYGHNGGDSGADFYLMNADASGVRVGTKYTRIFPSQGIQIHYDRSTGLVYADDGRVFDPSTGVLVGAFNLRDFSVSACLPDPVLPTVFFLGRDEVRSNVYTLRAFDKNTYRQIGTLEFSQATGDAHNLIRWGSAGIAFDTTPTGSGGAGVVYIVDGAFVNASADAGFTGSQEATLLPVLTAMAPESAAVGSQDLALTVSGSAFKPTTIVYWNSQALGTTYHSPTELRAIVPASTLAQGGCATISVGNDLTANAVNSLAFTVLPASSSVIVRNLSSPDIAWDPHSSRLYAPVSSDDPLSPNSIVAIDPADGSISSITGVGPDPSLLSISRDGTLGYVGYQIANLATQFHVPALDSLMNWALGADSIFGPFVAMDIQPAPDAAQTTAIGLGTPGVAARNRGLAIFDNATARPQRPSSLNLYDSLQWGLSNSVLYAVDNESTGFGLFTLGVDATGATLVRTNRDVLNLFGAKAHFDRGTGYLYADDGFVTDPATGSHVGSFTAAGLVVPDSSLNRVFILTLTSSYPTNTYTIRSFDQSHFTLVGSMTIPNVVGNAVAFTRWGTSGLAFVTSNRYPWPTSGPPGMLYIVNDTNFVR